MDRRMHCRRGAPDSGVVYGEKCPLTKKIVLMKLIMEVRIYLQYNLCWLALPVARILEGKGRSGSVRWDTQCAGNVLM